MGVRNGCQLMALLGLGAWQQTLLPRCLICGNHVLWQRQVNLSWLFVEEGDSLPALLQRTRICPDDCCP
jgi:hypothetical protein